MTEKNKIYNTEDFERYYAGTMPANEMHALEQAALEDPFLADALEGYAHTSTFKNDIVEIKERLKEKRKKKNLFSISSFTQGGWWRIAALLAVIVGIGYFFYSLNPKRKENRLAENEIKSFIRKKDSAPASNDTMTNDLAFENQKSLGARQEDKNVEANSGTEKNFLKPPHSPNSTIDKSAVKKVNTETNDNSKTTKNISSKYLLKGKVTDNEGKALPFAKVKNKSENEIATTDTAGRFLLPSTDSNTTAIVSVTGYGAKQVTLQKDKEQVITMNKNNATPSEVPTPGYIQKKTVKEAAFNLRELNGKDTGREIKKPAIKSLANNEKFDEYVKDNIQPVYDENNKRLTGEVYLSFATNKKGRPRDIKVVESACDKCDVEAIKLLKNGPDWVFEKNKWRTVLIKF